MNSITSTSALLIETPAWFPYLMAFFILASFVGIVFFLYRLLFHLVSFIETLFGQAAKSKTGQIIFSPAVGIPLFILFILVLIITFVAIFPNEIIGFFVWLFE
ncbi:MAG: hypothetical protein IJW58_01190 [Clostridia bacterium]|nr:hypothetical protein [Clostridia bacterium]